jgi:hypothetical protein
MIADNAIVSDVSLGHEKVVIADLGYRAAQFGAAVNRSELSKGISGADTKPASFSMVFQVVGYLASGHEWKKLAAVAELRWSLDHAVARHRDAVVENNLVANDRIWTYRTIAPYFGLRTYYGSGMYGQTVQRPPAPISIRSA